MRKLTRLPTQHKHRPHCAACGADLPTFDGVSVNLSPEVLQGCHLVGIVWRIRCACGSVWMLEKTVTVRDA